MAVLRLYCVQEGLSLGEDLLATVGFADLIFGLLSTLSGLRFDSIVSTVQTTN